MMHQQSAVTEQCEREGANEYECNEGTPRLRNTERQEIRDILQKIDDERAQYQQHSSSIKKRSLTNSEEGGRTARSDDQVEDDSPNTQRCTPRRPAPTGSTLQSQ